MMECTASLTVTDCSFPTYSPNDYDSSNAESHNIFFYNNTAGVSGNSLFGGLLDSDRYHPCELLYWLIYKVLHNNMQTVQPSRYCRDITDLKACVPNPAYTLVGTTNVPRSACSSIHAARWQQLLNYNGRGDVSSACANAALGAIINVTRT